MIRNTHMSSVLFAGVLVSSAALAFSTDATAQFAQQFQRIAITSTPAKTISKSGYHPRRLGNEYIGLEGTAYGYVKGYVAATGNTLYTGHSILESATARGYLKATGRVLSATAELARFDARGSVYSRTSGTTASGNIRLVLAGKTFVSNSFSKDFALPRVDEYLPLFPTDPVKIIPLWITTLRISGNAGVGLECSGSHLLRVSNPAVALNYSASAYGQVTAAAKLGWPYAQAWTELTGRFAEQTLSANLVVNPTRVRGTLGYTMQALSLRLKWFAELGWKEWSGLLFEGSWGRFSKTLFSL